MNEYEYYLKNSFFLKYFSSQRTPLKELHYVPDSLQRFDSVIDDSV